MVIYLPAQPSGDDAPLLDELTPREIVRELDKYVIGQAEAKKAVAIALRNRIRRQKLDPEMADEAMPKNILMIAPTGGGATELTRPQPGRYTRGSRYGTRPSRCLVAAARSRGPSSPLSLYPSTKPATVVNS